jgi:hypothetical protein
MPTMKELLGSGFGVEENVKVASVEGGDELDRIAEELGFGKYAEEEKEEEDKEEEKKAEEEEDEEEEEKSEKKASDLTGSLFNQLFPEDADLSKTAEEQEKTAHEQNVGARSYDVFADRFDRRLEKMAAALTGGATISAPTAADKDGNAHTGDKTPPQASKTNKAGDAADKIDTDPEYTNELPPKNDERTVGHYEAKHAAVMDAAMRKAILLSQLD